MRRLVIAIEAALLLCACGGDAPRAAAANEPGDAQSTGSKPAATKTATGKVPSATELDTILAPIALYPDQLLAQMLMCAQNPGKVAQLSEWLASHQSEKGTALQDAATAAGFDPQYVAMVLFPDVINAMAGKMDWTTQLGNAFSADRGAVFGSIQRLRAKAQQAGTLKDSPQQDVETKTTESGQQVIVIEPANPQVVYVPQYNPQVVYVEQQSSGANAAAAGIIGFTAGIAIGAAMDNNYYYGPYGWGGRAYMYNDAWDDYYDHREDAREDWADHREDVMENRTERAGNAQEQRTERTEARAENRPEAQAQRTERQQNRQSNPQTQAAASEARANAKSTAEARGYSGSGTTQRTAPERSGTQSGAFSGYSSGKSTNAASQRGQRSRSSSSSSRSGGGGSRRR